MSDELYLAVVRMRISQARKAANLKQEEVAEKVDLTHRHYQRYEAASHPGFAMSLLTLRRIANAIKTPLPALIAEPTNEDLKAIRK